MKAGFAHTFRVTDEPLVLQVKSPDDDRLLTLERVRAEDLSAQVSEMWLHGFLRQGYPDVPLEQVSAHIEPCVADSQSARCTGFDLTVVNPSGASRRCRFSLLSLRQVAHRAIARLQEGGGVSAGSRVTYELLLQPESNPVAPPLPSAVGEIILQRRALTYVQVPLQRLQHRARRIGDAAPNAFPVFYTERALARAERCSRAGAAHQPPVESGGVLAGSLCASPCGEFFCVITDVLDARDAEETSYSLGFSDRTWSRFQRILQARQAQRPESAYRLIGNCHGHNFLPNLVPSASDPNACTSCPKQAACSLTSAFASEDDQVWSQAVFAQQPWQLMHIFGLTPRSEPVHTLFGLEDGRLQERSFQLIPDFEFEL